MKQLFYAGFFAIGCFIKPVTGNAQTWIPEGAQCDSTVFTFSADDSLAHPYKGDTVIIDTSNSGLWQIGSTSKHFFADSGEHTIGMMTDSVTDYPVNANSSFILKIRSLDYGCYGGFAWNTVVTFRHKYQTSLAADGGLVEFSADEGASWQNVVGDCSSSSISGFGDILLDSFYNNTDTLQSGAAAFSGNSNGWHISRLMLFFGLPLKGGGQPCFSEYPVWLRFRFISDSTLDSLAGWIISDIRLRNDDFGSGIKSVVGQQLKVTPNPSFDGSYNFPKLEGESQYTIRLFDAAGRCLFSTGYRHKISVGDLPDGLYFYQVSNSQNLYQGRLLKE